MSEWFETIPFWCIFRVCLCFFFFFYSSWEYKSREHDTWNVHKDHSISHGNSTPLIPFIPNKVITETIPYIFRLILPVIRNYMRERKKMHTHTSIIHSMHLHSCIIQYCVFYSYLHLCYLFPSCFIECQWLLFPYIIQCYCPFVNDFYIYISIHL